MSPRNGFTLIEVVAALAILGTALVVLLDAHYTALRLQTETADAVLRSQLLESVVARAEVGVLTGELTGGDEFGPRYPGYSWSYDAVLSGDDPEMQLYQVTARVQSASDTPSSDPAADDGLSFWVYNPGLPDGSATSGGGLSSNTGNNSAGKSTSRNSSSSTSRSSSRSSSGFGSGGRGTGSLGL